MMRNQRWVVLAVAFIAATLWSGAAAAHGVYAHVHVTGWAAENLPEGELREFFREPEVFNALLFGAAFTDSGYASSVIPVPNIDEDQERRARAYGEHTHWEPFIEDFVAWIQANDPPPWTSLESRQRVAFLMGCGSHGLQDEIFDTLFLYQVDEHESLGQAEADPASDGFLGRDGHVRFFPEVWIPMDTLLDLYGEIPEEITEEVILDSVDILMLYVGEDFGPSILEGLADTHEADMPWTRAHYLDPTIPGSLRAEIYPTGRYLEAIWARLHGDFDPQSAVVFAFPEQPRRLLSGDHTSPDSWVSLIFGAGVRFDGLNTTWADDQQAPTSFDLRNTRWGHPWPRIVRLTPSEPLQPGGWYTVGLESGAEVINGDTAGAWQLRFQVECSEDNPDDCDDLGDIPVATIDSPDAGAGEDVGEDAAPDTSADTAPPEDTGEGADTDPVEADTAVEPDAPAAEDTGAAPSDSGGEDTAVSGGGEGGSDDGCGCSVGAPTQGGGSLLGLVIGLGWIVARRAR